MTPRALVCLLPVSAALWSGGPRTDAQTASIPAAAPGLIEAGAPAFVVLGPEGLGLAAAPTDAHVLPDGRLLFLAGEDIVTGDGVRWEKSRHAEGQLPSAALALAVDTTGELYAGMPGGFGRISFSADATWRLDFVAPWPAGERVNRPVLRHVIASGGDWFWHNGSGDLIRWRPGTEARVAGSFDALERVFTFRQRVFVTDRSNGSLARLEPDGIQLVLPPEAITPNDAILCSTPLDGDRLLVGTHAAGLRVFDGARLAPFPVRGALATANRVNDICGTAGGFFAAAIDNLGLVFFDRTGRPLQVLDRSLDHRLSRVRRLLPAGDGVLWALLNDGVARVQFPARVTHFEPLVGTGISTAHPYRHDGRLWLLADGKAHRGVYDDDGRLERFVIDSPDDRFVYTLSTATGHVLASTEAGLYRRETAGWRLIAPGLVHARILGAAPRDGRWLFGARREFGWLRYRGDAVEVARRPFPTIDAVYGAQPDGPDAFWLELGTGLLGRLQVQGDDLAVQRFGATAGVPDGWAQVFAIGEVVRFNLADQIFRFDEAAQRFTPDPEFAARYPDLHNIIGRPVRDAAGRLWITANGGVQVIDDRAGPARNLQEPMPVGLRPNFFTVEEGGVVWMHDTGRLARFDPAMPAPAPPPLRAVITRVHLPGRNRTLFHPPGTLVPLDYADNSLVFQFAAPGDPFGAPVSFEVKLDGAGGDWVGAGTVGSAVFNQLREGDYVLRVRPRAGAATGREATVAFTVRPPWHRTPTAYAAYAAAALGLVWGIAWLASYLQRREKDRLERVVAERTRELHSANTELARQVTETQEKAAALRAGEERYRQLSETLRRQVEATLQKAEELRRSEERFRWLNEELEQRVATRTAELNRANEQLVESNRELEAFSYSVSHDLRAPLRNISGFTDLLRRRTSPSLDEEAGRHLTIVTQEAQRLGQLIDSLLVFSHLNRADLRRVPLDLRTLIDTARGELAAAAADRVVEWRVGPLPPVEGDPTLLRQVFVNLLGNALKFTRTRETAVIEIGALPAADRATEHILFVRDNGAGFDAKYADKLFGVFQRLHSSRDYEGSGIGLATVRRIIARHGGRVWAEGAPNAGATFFLTLPASPAAAPRP